MLKQAMLLSVHVHRTWGNLIWSGTEIDPIFEFALQQTERRYLIGFPLQAISTSSSPGKSCYFQSPYATLIGPSHCLVR